MKVSLTDICDFQGGTQPPKDEWIDQPAQGYVRMLQIRDFTQSDKNYIEYVKDTGKLKTCIEDDILIGRYGASIGKILTGLAGAYNVAIVKTIPDEKVVSKRYLYWYLNSQYFQRFISNVGSRAAQAGFNKNDLGAAQIPLVDKEQQKEICEVLEKANNLISLRKQQLEKLDELVKARFVEMFGDINVNNKKWMTYPLGELCTIVRGGSPRPIEKYLGGTIPWIKISDATTGENIYLNSTKEYIIQEGVKKSRMIKAGSLIFANCGVSLGFARIITFDGCIHDGWLAMEDIDEKLDKIFLLYSLNQMTEYFRKTAPAGTQPNLNTNIMKMHRQIVPPMKTQKAFISFVRYIDNQKQIVQQSLEKLELMKKALMQEYFG